MLDLDPPTATCLRHEQVQRVYVSNWVPLYCGLAEGDPDVGQAAVQGLQRSGTHTEKMGCNHTESGRVFGEGDNHVLFLKRETITFCFWRGRQSLFIPSHSTLAEHGCH